MVNKLDPKTSDRPGVKPVAQRLSDPFGAALKLDETVAAAGADDQRLSNVPTSVFRPDSEPAASASAVRDTFAEPHHGAAENIRSSAPSRKIAGILAEYSDPQACLDGAAQVRDSGYSRWDVHTPYPVHGMDDAMGLKSTKLGWISMACGLTGCLSAVLMIQWMNGYDYPLVVGGKPADAFPAMVPIMFELSILLTGFGTVFGLLGLCRLPRHHHPVFESNRFAACSDDRFFISVESADPKFDVRKTRELLEQTRASHVEYVEEVLT